MYALVYKKGRPLSRNTEFSDIAHMWIQIHNLTMNQVKPNGITLINQHSLVGSKYLTLLRYNVSFYTCILTERKPSTDENCLRTVWI